MVKRFRKKGSIILFTLLMIIGIAIVAAIFINLSMSYEVINRVQNAADMGARMRAQAVDIALKERYGYIESIHRGPDQYVGDNIPNRSAIPQTEDGYEHQIYLTNDAKYVSANLDADNAAKFAIYQYLNANVGINTSGKRQIPNFNKNNICISVKPLPAGSAPFYTANMDFSCTATVTRENGSTVSVPITVKNVKVNGYNHPMNEGPDGMKVMNISFVAIAYEHSHFIHEALQKALNGDSPANWDPAPIRVTWSTAYPQIDSCSSSNACDNPNP